MLTKHILSTLAAIIIFIMFGSALHYSWKAFRMITIGLIIWFVLGLLYINYQPEILKLLLYIIILTQ